jgi:hypothetical protein
MGRERREKIIFRRNRYLIVKIIVFDLLNKIEKESIETPQTINHFTIQDFEELSYMAFL